MGDQRRVVRSILQNRALLRLELAFVGFNAAEYGVWIAMLVYAYGEGGATTAGLVALVQLAPAALFAPIPAAFADRFRPGRVLAVGYACAAVASTVVTFTRPAQAVLVPGIARTPDELTAANVVSGWVESASVLVAPLAAGLMLEVTGPGAVFAVFAVVALGSLLLVGTLAGPPPTVSAGPASPVREVAAGIAALRANPEPRLLVLLVGAQYVVFGMADLLFVVLAVSELDRGDAWAGYLNAAFGAGGVLGASAAALLIGRARIAPPFVAAAIVWGIAWAVLGLYSTTASAVALLALSGAGRSLFDVAGRTLLQRVTPQEVLARVFGVLESLTMAGLALGAVVVPILIGLGGVSAALVAGGAVLPVLMGLAIRRLLRIDDAATIPVVELALLRSLPIFRALPAPALEGLAQSLEVVDLEADAVVIRQGAIGDRYYAIADGAFEVTRDGAVVNNLTRGDGFGEIALMRDVPRTATVRARTAARVYALEKAPFVTALTGHGPSAAIAADIVRVNIEPAVSAEG